MNQHPRSLPITADIGLHCDDELGRPMAFMATFCFQPEDPYAVWVTFHVPAGEIPWLMDRSLLHAGLTRPAGDGDIRLWPSIDDGWAMVRMDFHTPAGRLEVAARSGDLIAFLASTWAVVPAGTEAERYNLDDLVASLLI